LPILEHVDKPVGMSLDAFIYSEDKAVVDCIAGGDLLPQLGNIEDDDGATLRCLTERVVYFYEVRRPTWSIDGAG